MKQFLKTAHTLTDKTRNLSPKHRFFSGFFFTESVSLLLDINLSPSNEKLRLDYTLRYARDRVSTAQFV
jgi:hypothetical protein